MAYGLRKLRFMHCMFPVVAKVPGIEGVNFPDVCPEQPHKSTIFCAEHLAVALNKGYPTDLKGFLAFCGSNPDNGMFALI